MLDKPGDKTEFSWGVTAPDGVETPIPLAKIADWFELHSAVPPQGDRGSPTNGGQFRRTRGRLGPMPHREILRISTALTTREL